MVAQDQTDSESSFLEVAIELSFYVKLLNSITTLGEIPVNFRGHILKLAGDRTFEDWSVTIINDSEFSARSSLEAWQQDIQELDSGVGMASNDYLLSRAFVEQLGKDDAVLARYEFFNMYPKNIAAIELNYETVDALEEFTVDFTYSHWERVK